MRLSFVFLILTALACVYFTRACEPTENQHGCKIYGVSCTCGFGCKAEFMYRSRRACLSALKGRTSNICKRMPCVRGTCIQTVQEPGFTCKCEGTGYYGIRCEKNGRSFVLKCMSRFGGSNLETMYNSTLDSEYGDNGTEVGQKDNGTVPLCGLVYANHCVF